MYKKKPFFITFEGIEGSGKTYQIKKLYRTLKNQGLPVVKTREPGGTKSAEQIRRLILNGKKNKFSDVTDTLLYLAARNEHILNFIKPAIKKKKIILCDRFIDSTFAYQSYVKKVNKNLITSVHKSILDNLIPNLTFILKINLGKAFKRLKKRGRLNRYDKFSKKFYKKAQDGFIKIAKGNKKRYVILDNSLDNHTTERIIFRKVIKSIK